MVSVSCVFNQALGDFANKLMDWEADVIKIALVDTAETAISASSDTTIATITLVGSAETLLGASVSTGSSGGVCDATDHEFATVTGNDINGVIAYNSTVTDNLICFSKFAADVVPNGGPILVRFDSGANKFFKI